MYAGDELDDSEVQRLVEDIEKYTLANHLFWGLWGIISVCIAFPHLIFVVEIEEQNI